VDTDVSGLVLWDVTLCRWVNSPARFEETWCISTSGSESTRRIQGGGLTLIMEAARAFETSAIIYAIA